MEVVTGNTLLPGDPRLIDHIVCELKSQGIFDQFRKECIADVDTKPAYQNLRQRVEGSVVGFLKTQAWRSDMNKNHLREMLRKNIYESGFLETGVERIVDQVVNPKINTVFLPQVEDVVYKFLGLEKPVRTNLYRNGPLTINTIDLLPTDLDPISPDSEVLDKSLNKSNETDKLDDLKADDFESPPFEPINEQSVFSQQDDSSNDSHLSGISGLTSHDSNQSATSPNKTYYTIPDMVNQDSQLSKVSSNSRLSIITTEDKHSSEKMDISDDTQTSKPGDGSNSKSSNSFHFGSQSNSENGYVSNFNIKNQVDVTKTEENEDKMELNDPAELKKKEILDKDTSEVEMDVSDSQDKIEMESLKITEDIVEETLKIEETATKEEVKEEVAIKTEENDISIEDTEKIDQEIASVLDLKVRMEEVETIMEEMNKSTEKSPKMEDNNKPNEKVSKSRSDSERRRSKHSESKDRKDDKKTDSDKDKKDKERKEKEKSRSSSSSKDKYRDKSKDKSRDKEKESKSKEDKDVKSDKDKSKSSSKHSSRDKERTSSKSSSKSSKTKSDKPKSDETKSKTDDSKTKPDDSKKIEDKSRKSSDSKSRSRSESSKSSKDRKSSSTSSHKDRKDSKKSSKRDKDDHFSSKEKKMDSRRSADRDSNDGSSGIGATNITKESAASSKSKSSENSFGGSNSGESGQSDKSENIDSDQTKPPATPSETLTISPAKIGHDPNDNQVKLKKPKFASNIFEARRLVKIRKKLEKLERKRQKQYDLERAGQRPPVPGNGGNEGGCEDAKDMMQVVGVKIVDADGSAVENDGHKVSDESVLQVRRTTKPLKTYSHTPKPVQIVEQTEIEPSVNAGISVISQESWDAIEAKINQSSLMNIDYDSYVDENAESSSGNKSPDGSNESLEKKTSDDEDCLYFNSEVSPKVERYLKRIDDLQKQEQGIASLEVLLDGTGSSKYSMAPPDSSSAARRSRKPNLKYCSNDYASEITFTTQKVPVFETGVKIDYTKKKGMKRRFDGDLDVFDSENNNKKMHTSLEVVDLSETEYEDSSDPSPNTSTNSLEPSMKSKSIVKPKKIRKEFPATNDPFPMPLSPDSDVSGGSVEVKQLARKASEEREGLAVPVRATRGQSLAKQRYSSDDLYKPRPLFTGSRRTRGLVSNADKKSDGAAAKQRR